MKSEDLIQILTAHGIKPTANRINVVRALAQADSPMTMNELEFSILSIDKSGVFRVLSEFKKHHLVHVIEGGNDSSRYELCHATQGEKHDDIHVHFFCEQCHRTLCLHDIAIPSLPLPEGFTVKDVNYLIKGICPTCQTKE